jgi:hypothetical protein
VKAPRQVTTELIDKLAYHRTECRSYIVTDAGVHDIGQQAGSLCLRRIPPKDGCNGGTHPLQPVPEGISNLAVKWALNHEVGDRLKNARAARATGVLQLPLAGPPGAALELLPQLGHSGPQLEPKPHQRRQAPTEVRLRHTVARETLAATVLELLNGCVETELLFGANPSHRWHLHGLRFDAQS